MNTKLVFYRVFKYRKRVEVFTVFIHLSQTNGQHVVLKVQIDFISYHFVLIPPHYYNCSTSAVDIATRVMQLDFQLRNSNIISLSFV